MLKLNAVERVLVGFQADVLDDPRATLGLVPSLPKRCGLPMPSIRV